MLRLIILFFITILSPFYLIGENIDVEAKNKFMLIKHFFVDLFPNSFAVQIDSDGIRKDIESIPKIYIKNNQEKPKLMLLFSQTLGIKVQMLNVAKGISKQYNEVASSFKSLSPFIQNNTYEEFEQNFNLKSLDNTHLVMQEKSSSKDLLYNIIIDNSGKILSIEQIIDKKPAGKVSFEYQKQGHFFIIKNLIAKQQKPNNTYVFRFIHYDLNPGLQKEDFLG